MSMWIQKKKKPEIVDLLVGLGMAPSGKEKKPALESELADFLNDHEKELVNDARFEGYYETLGRSSPTKAAATSTRRRQSMRRVAKTESPEPADSEPEPSTPVLRRSTRERSAPNSTVASRPSARRMASEIALPMSPGDLADAIDSRTVRRWNQVIKESTNNAVESVELWEKVAYLREALSNVQTIHTIVALYEFALLVRELVPMNYYHFTLPLPDSLGPYTKILNIPDFFALLSFPSFWQPVLFWFLNAIFIPLTLSYFINLSSTRKYDPLTFSVVKALLAYTVYSRQLLRFELGGIFTGDVGPLVGSIIGEDTPLIGASVGGLATIWDGIVKTR